MSLKVQQGMVVFRRWDRQSGLDETAETFSSLEEMFALCLQSNDPLLVDRVIIEGRDEEGVKRIVTLVFQSVTASDIDVDDAS